MIIPKRDAKCYGAVHIDNYLTFTGFCKKVDSNEICGVDVFVDGKKIDTLIADKRIAKVEEIYDIEGYGFTFELEEEYFEKSHTLEFKASSGEELVNSKIQTIDKNHPKFNEYRFLHSLSNVDVEKIKDLYRKDAIGFLATEENLNDKDFVEYIKELMERFADVEFKGFCFDDKQKNILFKINLIRCKPYIIQSIEDIRRDIEIFLWNYKPNDDITGRIISNVRNGTILSTIYLAENKNLTIQEWEAKPENTIIPRILNNLEYFDFTQDESIKANKSILVMLNNKAKSYVSEDIWEEVFPESSFYNFLNILIVKYWLDSSAFKHYYYETIHIKNEKLA